MAHSFTHSLIIWSQWWTQEGGKPLPKHFRNNCVLLWVHFGVPFSLVLSFFLLCSHKQICKYLLCLHVQVYAAESACGVFVSSSERPAPVINGVPVWGTTRRRTQSLCQTAAPPGLSFTWEEKGGKEGGWRGNFFSLAVLYSLFSSLCPSVLLFFPPKTIHSTPTFPTSSPFPLAPVLCSAHCGTFMLSHTCTQTPCEKWFWKSMQEEEKQNRHGEKRWSKGLKKNPEWIPPPPLLPCGSGMWPLFSVLNKPFK